MDDQPSINKKYFFIVDKSYYLLLVLVGASRYTVEWSRSVKADSANTIIREKRNIEVVFLRLKSPDPIRFLADQVWLVCLSVL